MHSMKIFTRIALVGALFLTACSKKDDNTSGGNSGSGTLGPANTWVSNIIAYPTTQSILQTELQFNTDHTVKRMITIYFTYSDTTYTTILPVYSGSELTQLQSPADSNASSGPATTLFDYTAGGTLLRIRYNPQSANYSYDSLAFNSSNGLQAVYHFIPVGTSGVMTQVTSEQFTWNSQQDITQVTETAYDTSSATTSTQIGQYVYDGSFNPYRTVKDLSLIMGECADPLLLTANNATSQRLEGNISADSILYVYNTASLPTSANLELLQQGALKSSTFTYFQYIGQN